MTQLYLPVSRLSLQMWGSVLLHLWCWTVSVAQTRWSRSSSTVLHSLSVSSHLFFLKQKIIKFNQGTSFYKSHTKGAVTFTHFGGWNPVISKENHTIRNFMWGEMFKLKSTWFRSEKKSWIYFILQYVVYSFIFYLPYLFEWAAGRKATFLK